MNKSEYERRYRMRAQGMSGLNVVVTIPPVVLHREAVSRNITLELFIREFYAVAHFGNGEGVKYTFEKRKR